jgi:hypothetical protein
MDRRVHCGPDAIRRRRGFRVHRRCRSSRAPSGCRSRRGHRAELAGLGQASSGGRCHTAFRAGYSKPFSRQRSTLKPYRDALPIAASQTAHPGDPAGLSARRPTSVWLEQVRSVVRARAVEPDRFLKVRRSRIGPAGVPVPGGDHDVARDQPAHGRVQVAGVEPPKRRRTGSAPSPATTNCLTNIPRAARITLAMKCATTSQQILLCCQSGIDALRPRALDEHA